MLHTLLLTFPALLCSACEPAPRTARDAGDRGASEVCRTVESGVQLPAEVRETSGLALNTHARGALWTHNDRGGEPVLYGIAADGSLLGSVRVSGAQLVDWEDLTSGTCASGHCLLIGDIGDNDASREHVTIYEVAEPGPGATSTEPARALHAGYPDGPRNAEALFALPSGDLFIVTKGDDGPVTLYRMSAEARADAVHADSPVPLERIRDIMPQAERRGARVTAAVASPDGSAVAIRTYDALYFHETRSLVDGGATPPITVQLGHLGEAQGEGVAWADDGTVWLTSEAENDGESPRRSRLECTLPW